ncbi:MAG: hypothetical protein LBR83_04860 [Clostridiales bacterium]|jgi:hypothetical protein|nr:hypothetical protein [Clostridiales bacterium]
MSTKRVKVREEKRKKKLQRKIAIACCIAVALMIGAAITVYAVNRYNESYVLTFEGEKVSMEDMQICSMFVSVNDPSEIKEQSMELLLTQQVMKKQAEKEGIVLTEEEKTSNNTLAGSLLQSYTSQGLDVSAISQARLADSIGLMETVYQNLLTKYTADYQVDEADFEEKLADYKLNNKIDYYDVQVKYIVSADQVKVQASETFLATGASFDAAIEQYSDYFVQDAVGQSYPLRDIRMAPEQEAEVLGLKVGERTGVMELATTTGTQYGIFYVDKYSIPDDETVSANYREQYVTVQKNLAFEEVISGWKSEYAYEINQKGYDAF